MSVEELVKELNEIDDHLTTMAADKLEELVAALSHANHMQRLTQDARNKAEVALIDKNKEIEALRSDLQQAVEIVRQHVPNIPHDGPTSAEHHAAYEAVGFALQDLERHVRTVTSGVNNG